MRSLALAALAFVGLTGAALAMPALPLPAAAPIVQVQLQCTPQSCIDPRTGIYTGSTCDRYGCRPLGGPVGRLGGYGGYDDDRPRRRRHGYDDGYGGGRRYGGGGRFDCDPSRCVDVETGRIMGSTCDRNGCRPLRQRRGY